MRSVFLRCDFSCLFARQTAGLLLLALAMAGGGCVASRPYHKNYPGAAWDHASSTELRSGPSANASRPYDLAFVEFGDEGSYFDPTQVDFAKDLIQHRKDPLLFLFIHGWHHNSSESDNDVQHFKAALNLIASEIKGRSVVGVYFGWHGEMLSQPQGINSLLTYYVTKSTAERLADNYDCFDAISTLVGEANSRGGGSILVGHSFGGLAMERAVKSSLSNSSATGVNLNLQNSLIVMLNPATESILTRQIVETFDSRLEYDKHTHSYVGRANGQKVSSDNAPFVVSITSQNDMATGQLFPIASFAWRLAHPTRGLQRVIVPPSEAEVQSGHPKQIRESHFFEHTPGHEENLHNYTAKPDGKNLPLTVRSAFQDNLARSYSPGDLHFDTSAPPESQDQGPSIHTWNAAKERTRWSIDYEERNAHVPYWIIQVPPEIINNHGGIWNDNSLAMLAAIYRMKFPKTQAHGRARAVEGPSIKSLPVPQRYRDLRLNAT